MIWNKKERNCFRNYFFLNSPGLGILEVVMNHEYVVFEVRGVDETIVAELAHEPTDPLVNTAGGRMFKMSSLFCVTNHIN
jgi:hypothetical protein